MHHHFVREFMSNFLTLQIMFILGCFLIKELTIVPNAVVR